MTQKVEVVSATGGPFYVIDQHGWRDIVIAWAIGVDYNEHSGVECWVEPVLMGGTQPKGETYWGILSPDGSVHWPTMQEDFRSEHEAVQRWRDHFAEREAKERARAADMEKRDALEARKQETARRVKSRSYLG